MGKQVSPGSLAALVPTQFKAGMTGNPNGRPVTKPITDAMRLLLAGEVEAFKKLPRTLQKIVGRWYGQAWTDPRGMALLLDRMEGRVGEADPPPLPSISFIEQHFGTVNVTGARPARIVDATPVPQKVNGSVP